jgi:serine/threonine protein kinase
MELADGGTLRQFAERNQLGSWSQRKNFCRQLCSGLLGLHNKGSIIHRDLKPENVMFVSRQCARGDSSNIEWTLKIVDFGLSRNISASQSKRVSHVGAGTETWMPPEGLRRQHGTMSYAFSYDVHPCGSLLYFLLSGGEHAFPGDNEHQTQGNLLLGKHRKLRDLVKAFMRSSSGQQTATLTPTSTSTSTSTGESKISAVVDGQKVHRMEFFEAMHLIDCMLQQHPNDRPKPYGNADSSLCMQVVLDHPFFMTPSEKLEGIRAGKNTGWTWLQNKSLVVNGSDRNWLNVAQLQRVKTYVSGDSRYRNTLKELARCIRNVREHVYDRSRNGKNAAETNSDLARFFGVDEVKREETDATDDMLVKYFASAVPDLFLQLSRWSVH